MSNLTNSSTCLFRSFPPPSCCISLPFSPFTPDSNDTVVSAPDNSSSLHCPHWTTTAPCIIRTGRLRLTPDGYDTASPSLAHDSEPPAPPLPPSPDTSPSPDISSNNDDLHCPHQTTTAVLLLPPLPHLPPSLTTASRQLHLSLHLLTTLPLPTIMVNGLACKDPQLVQAKDFYCVGFDKPDNTSNFLGNSLITSV